MSSIEELISRASDVDLCDGVFSRIVDVHGSDLDASTIPTAQRTVLLSWHAAGIIGNGGFNYLFEGSFAGDPYFDLTAEAFNTIGCTSAAAAFQKALALFPNSKPPTDIQRRLTGFRQGGAVPRRSIDKQFWNASDEITHSLAEYIRAHRAQFETLDTTPNVPRKASKPTSQNEPSDIESKLSRLPHWARVAFATHCARQLFPIFDAAWPGAPLRRRGALVAAVVAAERSAKDAKMAADVENAVLNATIAAGAALGGLYGIPSGFDANVPSDGNAATVASFVAKTAAKAAEAAQVAPGESIRVAQEAFDFAMMATQDYPEIRGQIHIELDRLSIVARWAKWRNDTSVPSDLFDI